MRPFPTHSWPAPSAQFISPCPRHPQTLRPPRASSKPLPKFSILFLPPAATPHFSSPRQHSSALFVSRPVMRDRASTLGAPRAQTYPSCTASSPPLTLETSSPPAVFCLAYPERSCRSRSLPHNYQ